MIEHLYATPVYYNFAKDYQSLNYHIDKVIDKVDFNDTIEKWGPTFYMSIDSTPNIIKKLGLNKIEKEIDIHLRNYCNELKFKMQKYEMVKSWFTKSEKGNYSHVHSHDADISGVYYYKTNGEDGDLFFETPNPYFDNSKFLFPSRWDHKPEEGKILLFPSWLKHGIKTNTTDNARISLSFDIRFI
jgi:uncharacterized protein (TIGR02466 family)